MGSIVTVVTPATSHDLTTLATVKVDFGISDTSQDVKIARWIKEASGEIARYCNRTFGLERVRETFYFPTGNFDGQIYLTRTPVQSIVSVIGNSETLDVAAYAVDGSSGAVRRPDGNTLTGWPFYSSVIEYWGGYALLDDLPYDIERACLDTIKGYSYKQKQDPMLKEFEVPGVLREAYFWPSGDGGLSPDVKAKLDPHRRIILA